MQNFVYYNFYESSKMTELMLALSNIYNFTECENKPIVPISIDKLFQFVHIHSLLNQFVENNEDPKQTFEELHLFLTQEQQLFGPRKFRELVQGVATVVLQYVLSNLRNKNVDRGVLCLTYFERSCQRYFSLLIRFLISMTYSLAQFSKGTVGAMQNYLASADQILGIYQKTAKSEVDSGDLVLLLSALTGINQFLTGKLTKAKSIFSDMISRITVRIHNEKMKTRKIEQLTCNFFVISTYYIALIYEALEERDISAYNLTQCCQFANDFLPDSYQFVKRCKEGRWVTDKKVVKLSRIQNKIERIKSLHSINKVVAVRHGAIRPNHSVHKTLKIKSRQGEMGEGCLKKQLQNIFTLDEQNNIRLKKRALKRINQETSEKVSRITMFQKQIQNFQEQKILISGKYGLDEKLEKINKIESQKRALKREIMSKIWPVVATLQPTKKIQKYFFGFTTMVLYECSNRFYRMLYNEVSLMGHLIIFKWVRKIKSKLDRVAIKTVSIRGVRHQIEFHVHKINGTKHIKVYSIEPGACVNDFVEVDNELFQKLKSVSLLFHFQIVDEKLMPLNQYFSTLSSGMLIKIKLAIIRYKKKLQRTQETLSYSKRECHLSFNKNRKELRYVVFVVNKKLSKGLYSHLVERIDNQKHVNPDYDIKVLETIVDHKPQLQEEDFDQILTNCILMAKKKHQTLITRIQNIFRKIISTKIVMKARQTMTIITTQINKNLFTLTIHGQVKTFFIEHLEKKYPTTVLKYVDFSSLSFVNKLREDICKLQDCNLILSLIQKYFRLRQFGNKLIKRSKDIKLDTNFQTKFKKSLCFAKLMRHILYKGKYLEIKALYMLTIKDFQTFPRPYLLRVFNLQSESLFSFDIERVIYMPQKIHLENHLDKVNQFIDILGAKHVNIIMEAPPSINIKPRRLNSKSSILSNYSFNNKEEGSKEGSRQFCNFRAQNRESYAVNRNKRSSINYKLRHKSALKQKDILMIKKWIEQSKQNSLISESSESSKE